MEITPWNPILRIAFRFFFLFFSLIIVFVNNGAYPFWEQLMTYPNELLHSFIPWLGDHVLKLKQPIETFTNGSGDTTYDWILLLVLFCSSLLGCFIWTLIDRKRLHYRNLYYWLTVAIRIYLGLMLISYGMVKIFKLQFPAPGLYRLTQAYGDSSPMGLAWTFLGFSKGYNYFMGIAEVLACFLLFRRTMTLAAIITLMTTLNVMAVNYFYDVPVKILSTTLVSMTLFLLIYNAKELFNFFLGNKYEKLSLIEKPNVSFKHFNKICATLKYLVLFYALGYNGYECYNQLKIYGDDAPPHKLYGGFEVEKFISNNDTLSNDRDTSAWKMIYFPYDWAARIKTENNKMLRYNMQYDTLQNTMKLILQSDTTQQCFFKYKQISNGLLLSGNKDQDSIMIKLKMVIKDNNDFLLMNRGFHWINETPFNR
ncbi:MAG: hypothetical protein RLZZ546_2939 [Bacteroidota bacterium]|jgi:uncharacterized membrane protein YphA (DoxX/SURF4 family)